MPNPNPTLNAQRRLPPSPPPPLTLRVRCCLRTGGIRSAEAEWRDRGPAAALALPDIAARARALAGGHAVSLRLPAERLADPAAFVRTVEALAATAGEGGGLEIVLDDRAVLAHGLERTLPALFAPRAGNPVRLCVGLSSLDPRWVAGAQGRAVRALRIDEALLRRAAASPTKAVALRDLMAAANHNHVRVVAAGLHSVRDVAGAVLLGCDQGQGRFVSACLRLAPAGQRPAHFPHPLFSETRPWGHCFAA
jgi:hypothetical protein